MKNSISCEVNSLLSRFLIMMSTARIGILLILRGYCIAKFSDNIINKLPVQIIPSPISAHLLYLVLSSQVQQLRRADDLIQQNLCGHARPCAVRAYQQLQREVVL